MGVEPEDGELGAIGQAELVQYRADAIADRAFAQEQSGGDVCDRTPQAECLMR